MQKRRHVMDNRGRIRFTRHGVRYEINKHGVLRSYRRHREFEGSERARALGVRFMDWEGRNLLWAAIYEHRYPLQKEV